MIKVGLTGGIASGKSVVANLFRLYSIPIYYSDQRAKEIIEQNQSVRAQIMEHFGSKSYDETGAYQPSYISGIVFSQPEKLKQLNSIVHPAVFEDQNQWFATKSNSPYAIVESALIVETNQQSKYDLIITVAADDKIRAQRIMERNSLPYDESMKRIANQKPQEEKIAIADFVIWNEEKTSTIEQVDQIHHTIVARANL